MKKDILSKIHLTLRVFYTFFMLVLILVGLFLFLRVSGLQTKSLAEEEIVEEISYEIINPVYSYEIIEKSPTPRINIDETTILSVRVRNTGNTIWFRGGENPVFLGSFNPIDRVSIFYREDNRGWYSGNRIMMTKDIVYPRQSVSFVFGVTAPSESGRYREYFSPLIEYTKWLDYKSVYWDIEVRDPEKEDEELLTTINGAPLKSIRIKLEEQKLYAYEEGKLKYDFVISTGRIGMDTPKGEFAIYNKFPTQYSEPYELYMDNWMAITSNGKYGIHALPHWKLRGGGKLYEGEDHLGTKISHGCIRLGVEESNILYDWAEVRMPVYIED